ncbi:hypothetical protein QTJ16_002538 [Diplocarpon rosae]|uniref:Uncharacterized protein n=1 Tax=Diplocarpon rosae TaxID=946125 RepID=A0AAD9T3E2_9HELO|nr:hypothetical protein QTJ16_002538 [Diplocarpon rosae]PBP19987.1 hypothetical protein BUE80_DR009180 [Diplocarpon rosae]
MSSPKQKKVHYERGTKGGSHHHHHHHHRSSRDSGVGSSSASDRASLGTAANESSHYRQIETQRHNLRAVHEALDAANDKIKQLEAGAVKLNALLSDSNKENRLLKKEKSELCDRVEDLKDQLEDARKSSDRLRRGSKHASSPRNSPPRREVEAGSHRSERRSSYQQPTMYPAAPQPSSNPAPNPFLPSLKTSALPITYAPAVSATYAPSAISYSSAPVFAHAPLPSRTHYAKPHPNDGKYHLRPL